jgi:hypothetical protein
MLGAYLMVIPYPASQPSKQSKHTPATNIAVLNQATVNNASAQGPSARLPVCILINTTP